MPNLEHKATGHPEDGIPVVGPPEGWRPPGRVGWWVRGALIVLAGLFIAVFVTAATIKPYEPDGSPLTMASHTQLGLPECNMVTWTGKPCPSCGMTTSFAHLIHGDVGNSLRANWAGTLLAIYWLLLVPWAVVSAWRGKLFGIRNGEAMISISIGVFTVLMLLRWAIVMLT